MINWISETKKDNHIYRVGRPLPQFNFYWRNNRERIQAQGIQLLYRGGEFIVVQTLDIERLPKPNIASYILPDYAKNLLLPHQHTHTALLVDAVLRHRFAVDGSDTGTGKTYADLMVAKVLNLVPVIVCPKAVIPGYYRACQYLKIKPLFIVNWEHTKAKNFPYMVKSYMPKDVKKGDEYHRINTISNVIWNLDAEKHLLIYDEAHRGKGEDTILSKVLIAAKGFQAIAASATIASKPSDMKALGYLLGLHELVNYHKFVSTHGGLISQYNDWEFVDTTASMAKIHSYIYPEHGSRMKISEIPDFPETSIIPELIEISNPNKQNRAYQELIIEARKLKSEDSMAKAMVLNLRYRQMAELLKVDSICEKVHDLVDTGYSVCLFVNFIDTLYTYKDKLQRYNPAVFSGTNLKTRESERKRFHDDECRVILVTASAGGSGLDLHDIHGRYPRVSIINPMYSPFYLSQIFGRVRRSGGKSKSIQYMPYASGTVEEKVFSQVSVRLQSIKAINEGSLSGSDLNNSDIVEIFGEKSEEVPENV